MISDDTQYDALQHLWKAHDALLGLAVNRYGSSELYIILCER